ncbi:MAG: glycosyltransferase [Ruminococcaceae bacterium]|nr:glycosyltransferase [Oscillospiraceae bacterium]
MDLISVIVPVYKVEKYLDKCIQSIVDQAYRNLEIILVDDGSPDRCGIMCDVWAAKDSRIKVIHKENGGLSDARNAGLAIAAGSYIAFVDSDDWIDHSYLSAMYQAIRDTGAGIAACDVCTIGEYEAAPAPFRGDAAHRICTAEEAISDILVGEGFRAVAWNKLYRRDYLSGERYPVGKHHEDEFFTYRILAKAEKLVYLDAPLYFYLQRGGSIMHTVSMKRLDVLDAYLERLAFLAEHFPRLHLGDKITFCISCAAFYRQGLNWADPQAPRFLSRVRDCRAQVRFTGAELRKLPLIQLAYVCGTGCCMDLFCRMMNLRKRGDANG